MMNRILRPYYSYTVVYLDDILIYSQAEHIWHFKAILQSIRKACSRLNGDKCLFGVEETSFVGYRVSEEGVDTEWKKVEAICSWSRPSLVGESRLFLGLAGYYRQFAEKFAHKSAALYDLVNACIGI
jgi:hypothetical protein